MKMQYNSDKTKFCALHQIQYFALRDVLYTEITTKFI